MSITVGFTDTSSPGPSGPITAWAWDFGDSSGTSTSQNPTYAYAAAGTYTVQLTVTGTGSDGTATTSHSITVSDPADLNAFFSWTASGLAVTATDLSTAGPSGPITAWDLDWGDSSTHATGSGPWSHTYSASGTYTIALTVTGTSPDGTADYSDSASVTSSSAPTFISVSSSARPTTLSGTPSGQRHSFTTFAQMTSLLGSAVAGDYIYYSGTSPLVVQGGSGTICTLAHQYSDLVTLDLGCSHNIWDPSAVSNGFVRFKYTGSSNVDCFYLHDCANLCVYGGEFDSGIGGAAVRMRGANDTVYMLDGYVAKAGSHGFQIQPANPSNGAAETIDSCHFRAEITRFCMNPSTDPHADKGTGYHGVLWHDTNHGTISHSYGDFYIHDPLRPGESSAGHTWPEGGGGSGIEIGAPGDSATTNSFALRVENMLMNCDGTNPGSAGNKQTGGNGINWWGSVPLVSHTIRFLDVKNITGQASHGTAGGWHSGSASITVQHGRSSNTNQAYPLNNLSSATDPYDRRWGITYTDCT